MLKLHQLFALAAASALPLSAQIITEREPNDIAGAANSIRCNRPVYGSISTPGEKDYYRFILMSPASIIADTTTRNTKSQSGNPSNPPSLTDSVVTIYDQDGSTQLAFNDDRGDKPSSVRAFLSRARVNLLPGAYYVEVRGFSSSPTTTQSIGDYVLFVNCFAPTGCGALTNAPAEVEPNDACAQASPSDCCELHVNTLQSAGDVDFYELTLAAPMRVKWETNASTAISGSAVGDSKIWLYDSTCTEIASNDDGGTALYSLLELDLAAGTYYLEVSHWQRSGAGDYELAITCQPIENPSAFAYDGTGCAGSGGTMSTALPRNGWAILGTPMRLELYGAAPAGPTVALLGTPLGPIDLTAFGAPGCELSVDDFGAPIPGTPIGPNEYEMLLDLPGDPALIGAVFSQQWLQLDPAANALGLTSSDRLTLTVGDV